MKRVMSAGLGLLGLMCLSLSAVADEVFDNISAAFAKVDNRISVVNVAPSAVSGLYEVDLDSGEVIYADAQGEYLFVGNLLTFSDDKGLISVTENRRKTQRADALAALAPTDVITYPAVGETTGVLHVFTDVDCFYCRKLHAEMEQINALGIQVNYLAFPRQGPGSKVHGIMDGIWCSDEVERAGLMTQAKRGRTDFSATCNDSPVISQYELGRKMGVTGTPALVLADGTLVSGYRPADQLAKLLGVSGE